MSPARPPEGVRAAARQGEGSSAYPARPPEGARAAARQGEGSSTYSARPPESASVHPARPTLVSTDDDAPREFVDVRWNGREDRIEYVRIAPERAGPLLVFLHEGLGSVTLWKDFPRALCDAAGCRGLVFSRWGYGGSSPRALHERWPVEFMHLQAHEFLPAFFTAVGIDTTADAPWLYGHSDGGSIALIHAASRPRSVAGLIVVAPHIFVEDMTIKSIAQARDGYVTTNLRSKLARYHDDPDSAFWGWNDVWLDPAFRDWNIEALLPDIRCPVLAVQGIDDEYGTLAQIEGIVAAAPRCEMLTLPDCGHSPHRDQPTELTRAVMDFLQRHPTPSPRP